MRLLGPALAVVLLLGSGTAAGAAQAPALSGWLGWGGASERTGAARLPVARATRQWFAPLAGRVTSQVLVARNVPTRGTSTVYVASSSGSITAFAPNGYIRWEADLGQHSRPCPQLAGYGVTGTSAIDPASRALYAVDPFGRLHSLDLASGAERPGWPVRVFGDIRREHVFGALLVVRGSVYVPTASFCDNRMEGKLVRVSIDSREVRSWTAVPFALGGGGGIWGFAGAAYSTARDSLFVATGNAFRGGTNTGSRFSESAGYGEQLVELSRDLAVRAASHPRDVRQNLDLDFASGPVIARAAGCAELVAALNKNGRLYAWRSARVARGTTWSIRIRRERAYAPVINQPPWSARHRAFYVTTGTELVSVELTKGCRPRVAWRRPLRRLYTHGSATVAGNTVWLVESGTRSLLGVDARSGRLLARRSVHGDAFASPTVLDGALYVGTFSGGLNAFVPRTVSSGRSVAERPAHTSFADARHGWQSRESGVYATDDGGRSWRRVFDRPALRVVRLSRRAGVLATGSPPADCACRPRVLWTRDGGRTWTETEAVGERFAGRGGALYWHDGSRLYRSSWPPRRSRILATPAGGTIVALSAVRGGVVALVSRRVRGRGWDRAPRVLIVRGGRTAVRTLPRVEGTVLARSLRVVWPAITVGGRNFTGSDAAATSVLWFSPDAGASWRVVSG